MSAFSDEELTAYLDGALTGDRAEALSAALQSDHELQARYEALHLPEDNFTGAAELLDMAPDMPSLPSSEGRSGINLMAVIAAGLAGLAIGLWALTPRITALQSWQDYAAAYQALYVADTLPAEAPSDEEAQAQLARVGLTINADLRPAAGAEVLDFRRAQVLGFDGSPLIQIAFAGPEGRPYALCVMETSSVAQRAPEFETLEGMASAHWQQGGYSFLLIGGQDPDLIATATAYFRETL